MQVMMEAEEEEADDAGESRDMGSLTGWQALANEVIAELGSGPQPGPSQSFAKGVDDDEEEMQVGRCTGVEVMCVAVEQHVHGCLLVVLHGYSAELPFRCLSAEQVNVLVGTGSASW